jgi:hypothetical protein
MLQTGEQSQTVMVFNSNSHGARWVQRSMGGAGILSSAEILVLLTSFLCNYGDKKPPDAIKGRLNEWKKRSMRV